MQALSFHPVCTLTELTLIIVVSLQIFSVLNSDDATAPALETQPQGDEEGEPRIQQGLAGGGRWMPTGEGGGNALAQSWARTADVSPRYNRVLLVEDGGCALGQSWAWEVGPVTLLGVHSKWTGSGHLQLYEAPAVFPGGFGAGS